VLLFARLRDLAGTEATTEEIREPATVRDVWCALERRYPALAPYGATVSAAVNAEYARPDAAVRAGDEVAFLPPVSGGNA
jgi:molybdopterin converting factor subunit 1